MDEDQYGLPDLRHLISTTIGHFPAGISPPALEPFSSHHRSNLPVHFDPIHVVPHHYTPLPTTQGQGGNYVAAAATPLFAVEMDCGRGGFTEGGNSRWPRQETLTLLEVRSRLDTKFREANYKGPLWDELSRIMSEEHGYQRSGKKCREKFENLYKYYKKTKEGKAGRQDGKNYRFFRQLEAIYGDHQTSSISTNNNYHPQDHHHHHQVVITNNNFQDRSFSISNSSHEIMETSSSENNEEYDLSAVAFMMSQSKEMKMKKQQVMVSNNRRQGWKEKVKAFVDSQMKKVMERQELWMDTVMRSFEQREQERVRREMEWKKQETERFDREHAVWAKERAWIEARDASLMEDLKRFTGQGLVDVDLSLSKAHENMTSSRDHRFDHHHQPNMAMMEENHGNETEILSLIQLRTGLESSFQECGGGYSSSSDGLWEVIAAKMGCLGHNLSAVECKDKWENITTSFIKITDPSNARSKG